MGKFGKSINTINFDFKNHVNIVLFTKFYFNYQICLHLKDDEPTHILFFFNTVTPYGTHYVPGLPTREKLGTGGLVENVFNILMSIQ